MELIIVRHSITQGNLEGRYIGRTDLDLPWERTDRVEALKAAL